MSENTTPDPPEISPPETSPKKTKRGRPSLKTPDRVNKLLDLASKGMTDRQLSKTVGITPQCLNNWKKRDFEFFVSLNERKGQADKMVEASLLSRATGYDYTEEASTKDNGIVALQKHAPPDPTSMIFWLKNRQPKKWRDKVEVDGPPAVQMLVVAKGNEKKLLR